jgi:hypothetical protein
MFASKRYKKGHNKLVRSPRESFNPRSKRRPMFNHNRRGSRLLQRIRDCQEEEEYSDQRGDQESLEEDAEADADCGEDAEEDANCGAGDSTQQDKVVTPDSPDLTMPSITLFGTKRAMGTAQTQAPATLSKRLRPDANNATPPPNAYISPTLLPNSSNLHPHWCQQYHTTT